MTDKESPTCILCGVIVAAGQTECPGCGELLKTCVNGACGMPLPREAEFCPFCGAANANEEEAAARDAATARAESVPPTVAMDSTGLREALSEQDTVFQAVPQVDGMVSQEIGAPDLAPPSQDPGLNPLSIPSSPPVSRPPQSLAPLDMQPSVDMQPVSDLARMAGTTTQPLLLECDLSSKLQKGELGLLRLRVTSLGIETTARLHVTCESALLEGPKEIRCTIERAERIELDPIRFVPRAAGYDVFRLIVEIADSRHVPLGRYRGSRPVRVDDPAAASERNRIEAGGDVIIMGNAGEQAGLAGLNRDPFADNVAEQWQPIQLETDVRFERRLARARPREIVAPPSISHLEDGRIRKAFDAVVLVTDNSHNDLSLIVTTSTFCGLGRGGVPVVRWLLSPETSDARQEGRLSRCHAIIRLENEHAWLEDKSTNGVWLNDQRIARDKPELLADGDELHLANVIPFTVRLSGDEGCVRSIWLYRRDHAGRSLAYVLNDGRTPLRLRPIAEDTNAPVWLHWQQSGSDLSTLHTCVGDSEWSALTDGVQVTLGEYVRLRWWRTDVPTDLVRFLDEEAARQF